MAEEKSGKKPDKDGGAGKEKGGDAGEVGGRASALYMCFADGAGNYVDTRWYWFTCWRCGALNYTP